MNVPPLPSLLCDLVVVEAPSAEGFIAVISINRPEKLNALNAEVRQSLCNLAEWVDREPTIRLILFRGAAPLKPEGGKRAKPKAFIAGADINEFLGRGAIETRTAMRNPAAFEAVWNIRKPTIAMIDGYCLGGGCELAMACDIRTASPESEIGQPEIKLGVIPGGGGTQRLPTLVGYGKAMELILTGESVTAEEALRIGILNHVFPKKSLFESTMMIAQTIASRSLATLEIAKRAVRAAAEVGLTAGVEREAELFALAFSTEDKELGVKAFLERSDPVWMDR